MLSKGQSLEPVQKALLEIAGCGRQDTFLRRMRALPAPRADLRCGVVPDEMQWRLILEWYAEFRALVAEVKRHFAGGSAAPGWLDDETLFRAAFDVTDAELDAPWWIEKARPGTAARQPGFAPPRNTPAIERLADPAFRPYTDAELEALRRSALAQMATRSLALGEWPRPKDLVNYRRRRVEDALSRPLSEASAAVARGLVWALSRIDDPRAPALLESAGRDLYAKGFGGFRCKIAGNAVLWSLGQIGTLDAARALARLVDSALEAAGARAGLGLDDMRDLATPDCGVGPDGTRTETLGNHVVTLAVVSSRKAKLTSLNVSDPKAKPRRCARRFSKRCCPPSPLPAAVTSKATGSWSTERARLTASTSARAPARKLTRPVTCASSPRAARTIRPCCRSKATPRCR